MVVVDSIRKSYGSSLILKDISFSLRTGEITGLLGPNGAGKTTLLKILAAYHMPDRGSVEINGHSPFYNNSLVKSSVGYLSEKTPLYDYMTVDEYLLFSLSAMGCRKKNVKAEKKKLLKMLSLTDYQYTVISKLSSGYRQRCAIAGSLAGDLSLLILDEPGKGLDPIQIAELRDIIRNFGKEISVIISSHILSEIETLCDRVLIMDQGTLLYDTESSEDKSGKTVQFRIEVSGGEQQIKKLESAPLLNVLVCRELKVNYWELQIQIPELEYRRSKGAIISDALIGCSLRIHCFEEEKNSLEEIFFNVLEGKHE